MTSTKPTDRPTAQEALEQFIELARPIPGRERRWHLLQNPEYKSETDILLGKPAYMSRYAARCSQIREIVWQLKSTLHRVFGKELTWPVPQVEHRSGTLS